jgi:hypothetical protein
MESLNWDSEVTIDLQLSSVARRQELAESKIKINTSFNFDMMKN